MRPTPHRTARSIHRTVIALVVGLPALVAASPKPEVRTAERFAVTPRLRDLAALAPVGGSRPIERGELEVPNQPLRRVVPGVRPDVDGALQRLAGPAPVGRAPSIGAVQFEGLNNDDNNAIWGGRWLPPDTNLDVGPTQVVETVNSLVRVYDKSGTPLTGLFLMSDLFSTLGGICSTNDDGDPVVLYDPLADRWILTQFAYKTTGAQKNVTHQCIAVSQTSDATGAYWAYDFYGPNTSVFGDYPHLGVWSDGYYMTTNQFASSNSAWRGAGVFAFERDRMLVGDPAARVVYFDLYGVDANIGGMLPSDFDGLIAPPAGAPDVFAYFVATEYGDALDGLRLFDFAVDWQTPASSTFVERSESPIAVASFNPLASGRTNVLQSGGSCSNAVDAITDRLMHRFAYRNLGDGHEVEVANHTVNVSGTSTCSTSGSTFQGGVRLYELSRSTGAANAFSVAQQVTYAPDSTSRWMGSAASDHQGNIGLGYSASSLSVFPSVRYTGRLAGDAANTLQSEATMIAGSGIQTETTYHRWGDYSALAVDPADDCTFWYAQEYYTAASQATSSRGWLTRIGTFGFAGCSTSPRGALEVTVTDCTSHDAVEGALVEAEGGYARVTDGSGVATISPIAPGSYSVVASLGSDQGSDSANVSDGATTQLAICLEHVDTTTVGNGTEPSNTALCPGGAATPLDAFTLATSAGTDTVTSATVDFASGTNAGLGLVEITSANGATVYGSQSNPADPQALALSPTLPVTTSPVTYRVRVTPKSAAAMPAPPGASYAVSGTISAVTSTNAPVYNDTTSATVTIDNASPGDPTWGIVTPGNGQVALAWSNPADGDFAGVVVLRGTSSVVDHPTEGTTYSAGNTIGAATVVYAGTGTSFTDTGVTNGNDYWYAIFARDACVNYSTGAGAGPYHPTAVTTIVGNGTDPANATLCPGVGATAIDAFTLATSTGSDTATAAMVDFANGTNAALGLVEITSSNGATVYGSQANPSDPQALGLSPTLSVTTTPITYRIRVTPKSSAAMPAPPGSNYAVTATISAVTSSNTKSYLDVTSATLTLDNASPANPVWGANGVGDGEVDLAWSNPADSDFVDVVVLRGTSSIVDRPAEGSTYLAGNTIGATTVVYSGAGTSFADTGVTNGIDYWYAIFARDDCANYSTGSGAGPLQPGSPSDELFSDNFESGDWCNWSADNFGTPSCST